MTEISSTKDLDPQAATGESKVRLLESIREQYKGETSTTHVRRMLDALKLGPLSTFEARKYLDVPHPAGRIQELRKSGNEIDTIRLSEQIDVGRPHYIAVYLLRKEIE